VLARSPFVAARCRRVSPSVVAAQVSPPRQVQDHHFNNIPGDTNSDMNKDLAKIDPICRQDHRHPKNNLDNNESEEPHQGAT
jgi:predicted secreted Zn-dependent protease